MLHAFAKIESKEWLLEIIGVGSQQENFIELSESLGLSEKVCWRGSLTNQEERRKMASADALILPSRFDGWGAVVNEALLMGTPVIVSDKCGVSDLIRTVLQGQVVKTGIVEALVMALLTSIKRGPVSLEDRGRLRNWASKTISSEVAAQYFLAIISYLEKDGIRPQAPWRS